MSAVGLSIRVGSRSALAMTVALALLCAVAWGVLASGVTGHMSHHELLGSDQLPPIGGVLAFLGNWQLMVVATMLPAAIPAMVARLGRADGGWPAASVVITGIAAVCAVWTGFGVAVLAGDGVLHRLVDAWPWLEAHDWIVTSAVLVGAGIGLLVVRQKTGGGRAARGTPWQDAVSGLGHCWLLMLVMFALALESLAWIAVLAIVMTAQRLGWFGRALAPLVGVVLIGAAVLVALRAGGLVAWPLPSAPS
jgi:predicted metal-binding membrane protein